MCDNDVKIYKKSDDTVSFARIALALASDYNSVYLISTKDDSYIEYSISPEDRTLSKASWGDDFYADVIPNSQALVYHEDLKYFQSTFRKENVIAALENGMKTVGVLAHGLDTIYPAVHRQTAVKMVSQGGLLTEYMSNTRPDKGNFVRRNRIVAGMSLCTIVVESAAKGGALITAELAGDYNREVCAFPGRPYDEYSKGCNHLIAQNKAHLISCLDDFLEVMQWENPLKKKVQAVQQELFPDVGEDEKMIIDTLRGADNKHINQIVIDTNLNIGRVTSALFELELKGIIQVLGGARYRLRH